VLVSSYDDEMDVQTAAEHGLILWKSHLSYLYDDTLSVSAITGTISMESGERQNLKFSCSESVASVLPGIVSFLLDNDYTIKRITETVEPVN